MATGVVNDDAVELRAGSPEDLDAVYNELRGAPGVSLRAVLAPGTAGEQGTALEFVTVACSGGAITILFQIVKTMIESRGAGVTLKFRRGDAELEITAKNVDEILPVLESLFHDEP